MTLPTHLRDWLLGGDSDPSVRYRVLREILDIPPRDAAVLRAQRQIGRKGWAASLLRYQHADGHWVTPSSSVEDLYRPKYISTNWRLLALSDLGVNGKNPKVAKAARLLLRRYSSAGWLGSRGSEVCVTGNAVRMLVRLGFQDDRRVATAIDWLVRHQKDDGGWHCFRSRTGTLDSWEALAAFAVLPPEMRTEPIVRAIERGAEFYLKRGLIHEGAPYPPWLRFHYPVHYFYDVLVGLDVLTALGYGDDPRIQPALDILERRRNADGSWTLDALHPDSEDPQYQPRGPLYPLGLEVPGRPSRWITTTALSVFKRAGRLG